MYQTDAEIAHIVAVARAMRGCEHMSTEAESPCCLVIEDNPFALDIMSIYLRRLGCHPEGAQDGKAGVMMYLQNPQRYRVVFIDLHMPIMCGSEAVRLIRGSGCPGANALPIVAMSGDLGYGLHESGFDHLLRKPFDMQSVATILGELIG